MFVNNTFHGTTVDDKNLNAMNIKFGLRWHANSSQTYPENFVQIETFSTEI